MICSVWVFAPDITVVTKGMTVADLLPLLLLPLLPPPTTVVWHQGRLWRWRPQCACHCEARGGRAAQGQQLLLTAGEA
jgi:hypothetical protein